MLSRSLLMIISVIVGTKLGMNVGQGSWTLGLLGAVFMLCLSLIFIWVERNIFRYQAIETIGGAIGFSVGICLSGIISFLCQQILPHDSEITSLFTFFLLVGFCYTGTTLGLRISKNLFSQPHDNPSVSGASTQNPKVLDTSAIIDGRIADLCCTGFLEGPIIVPQFVLLELQRISDSSDSHKRLRGKRGLDILQTIQDMDTVDVHIVHDDFPHIKEVDSKLVELAKQLKAKLITTDMNLNKVASLQGIQVLNANDLSNAVRPSVIPGESLQVFLLREGKEAGQGVAHLDDGTMVVVDHAKRWIGKHVEVVVTSVIQTSAGRMIFSSLGSDARRLQASFR